MNGLETRLRQIITNLGGTLPEQGSHLGVYLNAIIVALGGTARPVNDSLEAFLKNILELISGTKGTSADPLKAYLDGILAALPEGEPLADTTLKDYLDAIIARIAGYAFVNMGTMTWTRDAAHRFVSTTLSAIIEKPASSSVKPNVKCPKYETETFNIMAGGTKSCISVSYSNGNVFVVDLTIDDLEEFKAAVAGVILRYKKATTEEV